jgi:magnesium transporter
MARAIRRRSEKAGLPPGTIVAIGGEPGAKPRIAVIDYTEDAFEERELASVEESFPYKGKPSVSWINIDGIQDVNVVSAVGQRFGLHPLVLEDIANPSQRPKVEDYEEYIYIVVKMLSVDRQTARLIIEQVSLILGPDYVISFQQAPGDVFEPIRERIRHSKGRVRQMGADYLAYSLLDAIVDNYFGVLEWFGDETEHIEDDLVAEPTSEMLQTMHAIKREVLVLRKSVWPLREVVNGLQRAGSELICESTGVYLRDVYDHTVQVIDTVEAIRETVAAMRDTYLSSVSNRMNEVMKVLTIIATIFIPITFVAGIYGMNFDFMPELHWPWGYFAALGLMGAISLTMVIYFRRKGWL